MGGTGKGCVDEDKQNPHFCMVVVIKLSQASMQNASQNLVTEIIHSGRSTHFAETNFVFSTCCDKTWQ